MEQKYERKFRSPAKPQAEPRQRPRRRRSIIGTLLMFIGAATVMILLLRHVIIPLLVFLPSVMGGGA